MNSLQEFFTTQSISSTLLYVCLVAFSGSLLGKIKYKGVGAGVAGVLFTGLLVAHFGAPIDVHTLHFLRDFGLILFVYSVGLSMGPRFLSSFKKDGLLLNVFAAAIVLGGFGIACLIYRFTNMSPAAVVGILCGAVTNTPSLGAAQEVLASQGADAATIAQTGMAYAITYPFGILGIIISMLLLRVIFRIQVPAEMKDYTQTSGSRDITQQNEQIDKANISSVFIGIFAGILLGSIPIYFPGLPAPAKLGLAGGPLLVAIILGNRGRIGKLSFYITPGVSDFMRELGIILFLACVGLLSGGQFVETIRHGGWQWMLYGVAVTLIPIMVVGIIARLMKVNYLKICGLLAGSMTDPPALEFANGIAPVQAQAAAYAMVYPLTMFLRILLAQLFILITTGF